MGSEAKSLQNVFLRRRPSEAPSLAEEGSTASFRAFARCLTVLAGTLRSPTARLAIHTYTIKHNDFCCVCTVLHLTSTFKTYQFRSFFIEKRIFKLHNVRANTSADEEPSSQIVCGGANILLGRESSSTRFIFFQNGSRHQKKSDNKTVKW